MSQTRFAEHLGVKQSTVFRWEAGQTRPFPVHLRQLIKDASPENRTVFEEAANITLGQLNLISADGVSSQRRIELANGETPIDEQVKNLGQHLSHLGLRAKNGDKGAERQIRTLAAVAALPGRAKE
jgi:transcriptional regulator with XRE-family HTH domain